MSIDPWATTNLGIELRHERSHGGGSVDVLPAELPIATLIQPGLRRNPRRAHLLVSTVLGKHLPTDPRVVLGAGNRLGDLVRAVLADRAAVVLGFAETATGLGHCVAARIGAGCYLHSTRREVPDATTLTGFEEGHSHATSHMLQPAPADIFVNDLPLVLVDDEISTGATAIDAVRALHAFSPRSHYVLASLVDMRTEGDRTRFEAAAEELGARIDTVCLASGRTLLPEDLVETVSSMPDPELNPTAVQRGSFDRVELPWPASVPEGGRHGILRSDTDAFEAAVAKAAAALRVRLADDFAGRPAIVLGHEELMYLPLRLAAELADAGIPTRFQTTTRSPAYVLDEPGYPLRRGFQFVAPEAGEVEPRYLYNAHWIEDALSELVALSEGAVIGDSVGVPNGAVLGDGAVLSDGGALGDGAVLGDGGALGEGAVLGDGGALGDRACAAAEAVGDSELTVGAAPVRPIGGEPVLVVVIDAPADTAELRAEGGLIDVLTAAGDDVVLAVLLGADPRLLHAERTDAEPRVL